MKLLLNEPPFRKLEGKVARAIVKVLNSYTHNTNDHEEILSEAANFQVYYGLNTDMPESEIWFMGASFIMENASSFLMGYHAYVLDYRNVGYIFVVKKLSDIIRSVKGYISKWNTNKLDL